MAEPTRTVKGLSRREFLVRGGGIGIALVTAGTGSELLAACSSSGKSATKTGPGASGGTTSANIQLNYEENIQFAGDLVALDKGYYKNQGFAVTLLPGGPNIAPEPIVASGKALIGITHTVEACQAIVNGAGLTIIGAGYQKNPFCMISRASAPINTPQDMYGKKIGVSATNTPVWNAFVKGAKLDAGKINVTAVSFDVTSLASGQIDGLMGFYTNEPILLAGKGVKTKVWLFNDFGYPLMEEVYVVPTSKLNSSTGRAQLVKFMTAEAKGWQDQVADPALGAQLATNKYGKNLHLVLSEQVQAAKAQNQLVVSADTKTHGLFWMGPTLVAQTVNSVKLGGVAATDKMFTNEILQEVFKNGPRV